MGSGDTNNMLNITHHNKAQTQMGAAAKPWV